MQDNSVPHRENPLKGPVLALAAALLFGASTPLAKIILGEVHPLMLAAALYLGSGLGLLAYKQLRSDAAEAALSARVWLWFAPAILCGGILGPVFLLFGLRLTAASTASLLLILEGVFTALIAWMAFREHFHARIGLGMAAITLGAGVLAWQGELSIGNAAGPLLIVLACLAWAVDNNFTRKVALNDPVQIAMIKGLVAGSFNLALSWVTGALAFEPRLIAAGVLIGFFAYGVGLVFFVVALRLVGSARTAAYYSVAPFIGAAISVLLLGEPVTLQLVLAGALMAFGIWLHLTEHHEHAHDHPLIKHTHAHVHDLHHQHEHAPNDPRGEPHTHVHVHRPMRHSHAHFPDLHHTHGHG